MSKDDVCFIILVINFGIQFYFLNAKIDNIVKIVKGK